ncbi:alpha/beta fold hydrolase [Dictyobacter kobayashii]|uniref:AB hydrolase-1 domain-containing protein n=1 Tax=Dictyobacter kobayashii TaxID=2014872 RepID=A0A402AQS5_9CHLR|nr:alpha/beta hydrolase [Dictyobacter kobayashii]GCE21449.1 hypothetical protein KDK_52490 [Dictyobacter kobayashii]
MRVGPLLLLIHGAGGSSDAFDGIVNLLANQYTVVTYDRRGLSRSTLDEPQHEQWVETHSDDAHRLLKELGTDYEPAYVFGSGGGAVIGLDLVARHPEQIYTLIAHEPPTHLLPEADPIQELASLRESYHRAGPTVTFQKLAARHDFRLDNREAGVELPRRTIENREQNIKNIEFLFEQEFPMFDRYQFDFTALAEASTLARIVLAAALAARITHIGVPRPWRICSGRPWWSFPVAMQATPRTQESSPGSCTRCLALNRASKQPDARA